MLGFISDFAFRPKLWLENNEWSQAGHAKEKFRNKQIECRGYAYKNGIDMPEITGWRWPYGRNGPDRAARGNDE